ncbi:putative deoxynucleotide monophosphate kinase [Pseudarthrobacter siccitolerans]|uniref:Putative deoxynucleotide monophosphate kinase n=1 Tax=Pseudarthrobacter siccitolerans TaxID=861266 RepID=A0A024GYE2_9MICC|nr:hypothetical protein [Pseudarthrobacter siccitolerans]CCQ44652.1 putative deoxynucleotide monophosphate kinase [Pseudarthrobacter siccitolerans]
MQTAPIVGLIGKKRSGKDTFAGGLIDAHGFTRVAFADPVRQAALDLDPYVGRPALPGQLAPQREVRLSDVIDSIGWESAKDYVPEVRRILENFGTNSIRKLDPDFWVRMAVEKIQATEGPVVVTDVRFPNEADKIRELGGHVVRIVRPGFESAPGAHVCETSLDEYVADLTFVNDSTIEELRDSAIDLGDILLRFAQ